MDFVIEFLRYGLPVLWFLVFISIICKAYIVARVKRFDIAEIFFSFFRLYSSDERLGSSNRRRIKFMRYNNLINYFIYAVIGIQALFYFVTKNI